MLINPPPPPPPPGGRQTHETHPWTQPLDPPGSAQALRLLLHKFYICEALGLPPKMPLRPTRSAYWPVTSKDDVISINIIAYREEKIQPLRRHETPVDLAPTGTYLSHKTNLGVVESVRRVCVRRSPLGRQLVRSRRLQQCSVVSSVRRHAIFTLSRQLVFLTCFYPNRICSMFDWHTTLGRILRQLHCATDIAS